MPNVENMILRAKAEAVARVGIKDLGRALNTGDEAESVCNTAPDLVRGKRIWLLFPVKVITDGLGLVEWRIRAVPNMEILVPWMLDPSINDNSIHFSEIMQDYEVVVQILCDAVKRARGDR